MTYNPLSDDQISQAIAKLKGWERVGDTIQKSYKFGSFQEAIAFIVRISFVCEKHNHHPELFNVYNNVKLTFSTHDAGNVITDRDITVATEIDAIG